MLYDKRHALLRVFEQRGFLEKEKKGGGGEMEGVSDPQHIHTHFLSQQAPEAIYQLLSAPPFKLP